MEHFPPSTLRLFLSVDIVGSTSYKQSAEGFATPTDKTEKRAQRWLEPFSAFFPEFDRRLDAEWDASLSIAGDEICLQAGSRPVLWKAAGDEVIYRVDITAKLQPLFAVNTFRYAVVAMREVLKAHSPKLDLKATAWLAGFPINNAEFVIGGNEGTKLRNPALDGWWDNHFYRRYLFQKNQIPDGDLDFIGPQMDLGFRLCGHSTPRRMMLSVDLALMLVETIERDNDDWPKRFDVENRLFFDGTKTLKGVLAGVPYPLLWIDAEPNSQLNSDEDQIRGRNPPTLPTIRNYCSSFIEQMNKQHKWMMRPFVVANGDESYGLEPEEHKRAIKHLRDRWDELHKSLENLEPTDPEIRLDTAREVDEMSLSKLFKAFYEQ